VPTLISESEVRLSWDELRTHRVRRPPVSRGERSAGIHVSAVLKATGAFENSEVDDEEVPLRMCVGQAWENFIVGLYPDLLWQPGELERDGVMGTPDGLSELDLTLYGYHGCAGEAMVLEEFKATWQSLRQKSDKKGVVPAYKRIAEQRRWMWQMAAYCAMGGWEYGRLHVLWVNGDYRPPAPIYTTHILHFPVPETSQFWSNVILKNKEKAVAE
jgi:hypothetical protein